MLAALGAAPALIEARTLRVAAWTRADRVLQADGLTARVNGEPAPVVRLQGPGEALMVLLVLDLVGDLNKIELAREGLVSAFSKAPRNLHLGILRAPGGLRVLLDPTDDHHAMARAIRGFPVSGAPALLETITGASGLADSIISDSPARVAVLYVTDSEIRNYREDFSNPVVNESDDRDLSRRFPEGLVRDRVARLSAMLAASQAPVFVVHLSYKTDRLDEAYQSGILQLASTTGGAAVFCRSDAEIPEAIRDMTGRIVSHYAVDIQAPSGSRGPLSVSLEAAAAGELDYRSRYH